MTNEERTCPYYANGDCELGEKTAIDDKTGKSVKFDNRCDEKRNSQFRFSQCSFYRNVIALLDSGLPIVCPYRKICSDYTYEDGLGHVKEVDLLNRELKDCRDENSVFTDMSYIGCFHFSRIFWDKKTDQKKEE